MKTGCCNTRYAYRNGDHTICVNPACENYLGDTTPPHNFSKWKNPIAVSVFVFYLVFSIDDFGRENEHTNALLLRGETPLTLANLQKELKTQNIICPREVFAQIKIESGNLQSFLLKRTNNMLGMRYPFKRQTKACGIYIPLTDTIIYGTQQELKKYSRTGNYAVYKSWKDAVADYKLWQENSFNITERYLAFLGNVYAEDSLYVKKIQQVALSKAE